MQILVDTHILLWALAAPEKLTTKQHYALENPANLIWVSSMSIAELMIKCSIGKLSLHADLLELIAALGFEHLPYTAQDAQLLKNLPFIHRDPFDRMLITQTINNKCIFMSNDRVVREYDCRVF